ncbi:MAG TPA: class I SAM-dependent methyltransferase [Bacteroidales bacterium]|nr:class I SAM-dependent methyltransferase [Bacteroidales bacterium]HPJ58657.1 class I SAM-dependent methyltransferase [Bacteroidales bacterium]HPR12344.1 class I SAM-dependent methyltransferase [Bacteroidales bacterium]
MKIEEGIIRYLRGDIIDTGLKVQIRRDKYPIISREAQITEIVKNKSVIHVGCSDHIQIIDNKIKNDKWLHKLITDNSSDCIGIDIDRESIEYIRNKLGYKNVYHGNILSDDLMPVKSRKWDYVVFGEIIEHLDNPVDFLEVFKEKYGDYVSRFVITVPNIYNKHHFRDMLGYIENINTDHRFSFTPYTINKVIFAAGYIPEKMYYANLIKLNFTGLVLRKLKYILHLPVKYPYFYFNSIIVTGSVN